METRLGQHNRDLLLGQAFHQLPQLVALSTHLPNGTGLGPPEPFAQHAGTLAQSSNANPNGSGVV